METELVRQIGRIKRILMIMNVSKEPSRLPTGVPGLDEVLLGGLPQAHTYLVEGHPGTGKTTLGLQFVIEGARAGERCLYVTLSETKAELEEAAQSHNWSLDGISIAEFVPDEASLADEERYTVFHPGEVELATTIKRLLGEIELGCIDIFGEVYPGAGEADGGLEAESSFAVACGESAELFQAVEAAFDAVAQLVEGAVMLPLHLPMAAGRDHGHRSHALDFGHDGGRVVALVGQHGLGSAAFQQRQGLGVFGGLARSQAEGDGLAQAVSQQMDLGAQSTSGTPQSLVFEAPFLRPVAACWWARTIVESSIR